MTSGSAAAPAAGAATSVVAAAGSSTRSATTWTIIVSPSVTVFHFGFSGRSRTRIDCPSISSVTSTSMCSGMSVGSVSISICRLTKSTMPPCSFTPRASPFTWIGTVTVIALSMAS